MTYDGSNLSLYVNGTRISRKKVSGTIARSSSPLQIGGDNISRPVRRHHRRSPRLQHRSLGLGDSERHEDGTGRRPCPTRAGHSGAVDADGSVDECRRGGRGDADLECLVRQRRSGRISDLP